MMGPRQEAQAALFYKFPLEEHVTQDYLLRSNYPPKTCGYAVIESKRTFENPSKAYSSRNKRHRDNGQTIRATNDEMFHIARDAGSPKIALELITNVESGHAN